MLDKFGCATHILNDFWEGKVCLFGIADMGCVTSWAVVELKSLF